MSVQTAVVPMGFRPRFRAMAVHRVETGSDRVPRRRRGVLRTLRGWVSWRDAFTPTSAW